MQTMNPRPEQLGALPKSLDPHVLRSMRHVLGRLPDTYVLLDLNTTGLEIEGDVIVRAMYHRVEQGVVVDRDVSLLNWPARPDLVDTRWFGCRLAENEEKVSVSRELLASQGSDPENVLRRYCTLIRQLPPGVPLVGHSVFSFDLPMLRSNLANILGATSLSD